MNSKWLAKLKETDQEKYDQVMAESRKKRYERERLKAQTDPAFAEKLRLRNEKHWKQQNDKRRKTTQEYHRYSSDEERLEARRIQRRKSHARNAEKISMAKRLKYRDEHPEVKRVEYSSDADRASARIAQQKAWRSRNKDAVSRWNKASYYKHRLRRLSQKSEYYKKNRATLNKVFSERRAKKRIENPMFVASESKRKAFSRYFRLKSKSGWFGNVVGMDAKSLHEHIEAQWKVGMTWDNYGHGGWVIDHIIPCSGFDLRNPEEVAKCYHFSNLRPLWWKENLAKGRKMDSDYDSNTCPKPESRLSVTPT